MSLKKHTTLIMTALSLVLLAFAAEAATDSAADKAAMEAKVKENMKYTVPGEAHKNLGNTVGNFDYTMTMWMDPKSKPETATGKSENKWILGGRYVQQDIKGSLMGQSFEGIGLYGYDNYSGEYQTVWLDNMATAIAYTAGEGTPTAKSIRQEGTASNPMKGDKKHWFRTELKVVNPNEHTYAMYTKDQTGKEYKSLEIKYKRSKQ